MKEESLIDCFKQVNDYREGNATEHKLIDIIIIAVLAVICGADHWTEIETFGKSIKEWLSTFLELPNGIPSHDTFGRIFSKIDPEEFHNAFMKWVQIISKKISGEVISIDGKTVRRSHDKGMGKSPIHIVSAWANENNLVLGQTKVEEKSNEITAIPELIKLLDIENCIITIDAMGTQKKIAKTIVDNGGDYLLALKGNQKTLYEDIKFYFEEDILNSNKKILESENRYQKTLEKNHGRIEKREHYVINDISWIEQKDEWKNFKSAGMIVSTRTEGGKTSKDSRFYISSKELSATELGMIARTHWGVETKLHWVLDISFREDECRIRKDNAGENFALLRKIAVNLIKNEKTAKIGVKSKRLKCGWDMEYLKKVLMVSN